MLVLRRHELMRRLGNWAKKQGARLMFDTKFSEPVFDSRGKLAGAILNRPDGALRVQARLCADASGFSAALRTSLPENYGVETFKIDQRNLSYLILHYVKLKDPDKDAVNSVTTWCPYHIWLAPSDDPEDGALIGVGTGLSYEKAEQSFKTFAQKGYLPDYELDFIEKSNNCRHRSLHSFVADGFIALGDAACIANPKSGEGITSAWNLCSIAAEEFGEAMKDGTYPTADSVWKINTKYMRSMGALYAMQFASRTAVSLCNAEETDYMFAHSIFYQDEKKEGEGRLGLKLLWALLSGGLSRERIRNFKSSLALGNKIFKHYLAYPENPAEFASWVRKADELWTKAGRMPGAENPY
jgi:electron-transferring-flavoprotein dehydrogenase